MGRIGLCTHGVTTVGGVTAGHARHNSTIVGGATACQVGTTLVIPILGRKQVMAFSGASKLCLSYLGTACSVENAVVTK